MQERNALFKEVLGLGVYKSYEYTIDNISQCYDSPDLRYRPTLRYGSQGVHVKYLQHRLNCHKAGYTYTSLNAELQYKYDLSPIEPLKEDGIFGPKTYRAVLSFQSYNKLENDGVVGPKTWAKLNAVSDIILVNNPAVDEATIQDLADVIKSEAGDDKNNDKERRCVGWVYRNRPKGHRGKNQFSREKKAFKGDKFYKLAEEVLNADATDDPTGGATHYFSPASMPPYDGDHKNADCKGKPECVTSPKGNKVLPCFPGWTRWMEPVNIEGVREWYFKFYRPKKNKSEQIKPKQTT